MKMQERNSTYFPAAAHKANFETTKTKAAATQISEDHINSESAKRTTATRYQHRETTEKARPTELQATTQNLAEGGLCTRIYLYIYIERERGDGLRGYSVYISFLIIIYTYIDNRMIWVFSNLNLKPLIFR